MNDHSSRLLRPQSATPVFAGLLILLVSAGLQVVRANSVEATFPGTKTLWNNFDRYDFEIDGKPVLIVCPPAATRGKPWIWHGEFFGHKPEPDIALLARGFHVVYTKNPDLFGAPQAVAHWNKVHAELTQKYGLADKAALVGVSRGGLYCYNWAAANPDKVACIYGDAPVCDAMSWPVGRNPGEGNANEIPKLLKVYDVETVYELFPKVVSPVNNLVPLARAGVPLLHVYGDADTAVPWKDNTGLLAERYRILGGDITLIPKPGIGHVHGLDDPTPIIDFLATHSLRAVAAADSAPRVIGSRRELFVDHFLIERLTKARLHLHEPRSEGRVLSLDAPQEGPFSAYTTVLQDSDRYLMYYRGVRNVGRDGDDHERTCLAISSDGIHWTKPELGLFEHDGSSANNIVLANAAPITHNFCPMIDTNPGVAASERFKAVGGTGHHLYALISADGIHWKKLREEPILSDSNVPFPHVHMFDSQNLVFWSEAEQKYVCYFRVWDGVRRVARSTSDDFANWSPAVMMLQLHNDGHSGTQLAPTEHLYTNQTSPYFRAPHLYVSTAARFFEGRQVLTEAQAKAINVNPIYFKDTSDSVFMTSRGGNVYDRTFLEGYLKPGIGAGNWVSRTNYPALNLVQTGPTEMSFYVNQNYAQPTAQLQRYSLRLDGFASVRAGADPGELLTRPLIFDGSQLKINFATSAAGGLRFELQTPDGQPIPDFKLEDCQEQIGNEIERIVSWKSQPDLRSLAGQPVRLRCVLKDADLFAIRFE